MLADLLNVPETPQDWERWGNSHALNHIAIIQAVRDQLGRQLDQLQLYPFPLDRPEDFLERNQRSHFDVNILLGLTSIDLQDVDLKNRSQLVAWISAHHQSHYDMCSRLGISV